MYIQPNDSRIRYTGRWNVTDTSAASSAMGNYLEFAFTGDTAVLSFDITNNTDPNPHLFISVDNGARVETVTDAFIRISAPYGDHTVKVILKSAVETQNRWYHPVEAMVRLTGIEADAFIDLPADDRKIIEFVGDSITEGISIDCDYGYRNDNRDMVYWDDSTAGYAWLTAEALNMRPVTIGYGYLGTTHAGNGAIPKACESYPYYSDGCPVKEFNADYILINYGANDRGWGRELLEIEYTALLTVIREHNPSAQLICVSPYCGELGEDIEEIVNAFNAAHNDSVFFINPTGWVPPEPLHPTREGNRIICKKLSSIIKEKFSL